MIQSLFLQTVKVKRLCKKCKTISLYLQRVNLYYKIKNELHKRSNVRNALYWRVLIRQKHGGWIKKYILIAMYHNITCFKLFTKGKRKILKEYC